MTIQSLPIDSISPDPANVRRHGDRNIEAIRASLRRFGQQKPIVVDSNNIVRAGNGTLAAAKSLGWTEIQVVRSDLEPVELTAFAIADNRTAELAEWDAEALSRVLADGELGDVGFDDNEIRKLIGDVSTDSDSSEAGESQRDIGELFEVVVECPDEERQKEIFERLTAEGLSCRLLTL